MSKLNEKVTWEEKVLARLNLSDRGKVGLMKDLLIKTWKNEIKEREKSIKELKDSIAKIKDEEADWIEGKKETIAELEEERDEVFITVDPEKIATREQRLAYILIFDSNCNAAISKINRINQEIVAVCDRNVKIIENIVTKDIPRLTEEIKIFSTKLDYLK